MEVIRNVKVPSIGGLSPYDFWTFPIQKLFGGLLAEPRILDSRGGSVLVEFRAAGPSGEDRLLGAKRVAGFSRLPNGEQTAILQAITGLSNLRKSEQPDRRIEELCNYFAKLDPENLGEFYLSPIPDANGCRLVVVGWGVDA